MRHLDVIQTTVTLKSGLVFLLHYYRHALLGFRNSQFCGVETGIFGGHTVEINIQSVRQFADGDTDSARSEVVGLLDKTRHLGTAEKALYFSLFRCITFLHLAAARLQRCLCMLFARTCGATYAVPARATAQQKNHIAGCRTLATHGICFDGTDYSTYFQTFCHIRGVINLTHMRRGKTYLVAIRRIACSRLAGDDLLR